MNTQTHSNPRVELAAEAIRGVIDHRVLTIGDFLEALDLAMSRHYRCDLEHLVRVEELRLIREVHAKVIAENGPVPLSPTLLPSSSTGDC